MWQNPQTDYFGGALSLWGNYTGDRGGNNRSPNYGMWVQQDHPDKWYTKINGTSGVRILAGTNLSLSIWKYPNHAGLSFASSDAQETNGGGVILVMNTLGSMNNQMDISNLILQIMLMLWNFGVLVFLF